MKPPAYVQVTITEHNPECWRLPIGNRAVCWRFWPADLDGKRPHGPFVTFEGSPSGPATAEDMERLAEVAALVAERIRADEWRATGGIFDLEEAS